jgi:hypothetical protein
VSIHVHAQRAWVGSNLSTSTPADITANICDGPQLLSEYIFVDEVFREKLTEGDLLLRAIPFAPQRREPGKLSISS